MKRRLPVVLSMPATEGSGVVAVKSVLPGNGISIMVYDLSLVHISIVLWNV